MNKRLLMSAVFGDTKEYVPSNKTLAQALDRLTEREKYVIQCRFGNNHPTLKQTAVDYPRNDGGKGVTQERIRQVEAKALRRLKYHNNWTNLWPEGNQ